MSKAATAGQGSSRGGDPLPMRLAALLVLLVLLPYLGCLGHGFVYDDEVFVERNPEIATVGRALEAFGRRYWPDGSGLDFYRPLTVLSLAVDRSLGDGAPWVFHCTNLLLHLGAVLLFFSLLRRLDEPAERAFAAAALFALWPTGVEVTAWVSGRGDGLVLLFGLVAAHLLLPREGGPGRIALATLAVLGALLAKESAVALPPILLLLVWVRRREAGPSKETFLVAAGMAAALAGAAFLRLKVLGAVLPPTGAAAPVVDLPLEGARFLVHAPLLLANLVSGLHPRWPFPGASPWGEFVGLVVVGLAPLAWAWRRRGDRPRALALLGLFWLALSPALLQLPAGYGLARRYLYGPSLFLSLLLADSLSRFPKRRGRILLAALLLPLGAVTAREAALFADSETLWSAEALRNPRWRVAVYNLGNALRARGALAEATHAYERAAALAPRDAEILVNLGAARNGLGRHEEAREVLARATALDPGSLSGWNNLGNALLGLGRPDESLAAFERALALSPRSGALRYNMARALHRAGRDVEARRALAEARRLDPGLDGAARTLLESWGANDDEEDGRR